MRVAIVKTSSLGDVIQALDVAKYLKVQQRVATVGWVVEESIQPLVESCPHVDLVLPINSKKVVSSFLPIPCMREWREQRRRLMSYGMWDVVFDLQGNAKSMLVTTCLLSHKKVGYGWKTAPEWVNLMGMHERMNPPHGLSMRQEYLWFVRSFFSDHGTCALQEPTSLRLTDEQQRLFMKEVERWPKNIPIWVVAAGSRWNNKKYPSDTMRVVLEKLTDALGEIFFVFVAGSCEELQEVSQFASRFLSSSEVLVKPELPLLANILAHAERVVAMDSMILHLAALSDVPTFSLFGPSSARKYAPEGQQHGYFQGGCPVGISFEKRCPLLRTCPTGACLKTLPEEELAQAILRWNERVILLGGDQNRCTVRRGQ